MEDKLIKLFNYIFWFVIMMFIICLISNALHWMLYGEKLFPFYYLSPIILLPFLGYCMMIIGEYLDKLKQK
jgi:hypothetical protein